MLSVLRQVALLRQILAVTSIVEQPFGHANVTEQADLTQ
jgi:hypothetical protein